MLAAVLTRFYLNAKDAEVRQIRESFNRKYGRISVLVLKHDLPSGTVLQMSDLGGMDVPEIGAMIESLEAFGNCGEIAGVADFISVGTNDLALSAFNTRDYKDHGDELVGYVKKIVDIAHEKGIKVTVCGEMASDFSFAEKILKIGADGISVTPSVVRVLV